VIFLLCEGAADQSKVAERAKAVLTMNGIGEFVQGWSKPAEKVDFFCVENGVP
jgi:hypothetical protein